MRICLLHLCLIQTHDFSQWELRDILLLSSDRTDKNIQHYLIFNEFSYGKVQIPHRLFSFIQGVYRSLWLSQILISQSSYI